MNDGIIIAGIIMQGLISIATILKVEKVHKATNSMHDALIKVTEQEALARGIKEGVRKEKESQKESHKH